MRLEFSESVKRLACSIEHAPPKYQAVLLDILRSPEPRSRILDFAAAIAPT